MGYTFNMSKVIVSGSIAYDRIMDYPGLFAEHILADKAHSINLSFAVEKLSVEFGGTAGNVAYSLALLGEKPEIISTAGNDFSQYKTHLRLSGIDATTVHEIPNEPTASAFILTDKGDNQIAAFHFGAGAHPYDIPVETEGRAVAIVSAGCEADMMALPEQYRQRSMRFLYDPGQAIPSLTPEALKSGMHGAHVVFASDYELSLIMKKTGLDEKTMLEHTANIIITYGENGSRLLTKEGEQHIPAIKHVAVVDPTGAGDAYRAGFIKGLILGLPLIACARLGSTVAAYAVEVYGTQAHKFTLEEMRERHRSAYDEQLTLS